MIKQLLLRLLKIILLLPVVLLAFHTLVRFVRCFVKFPIPQFLANSTVTRWAARAGLRPCQWWLGQETGHSR